MDRRTFVAVVVDDDESTVALDSVVDVAFLDITGAVVAVVVVVASGFNDDVRVVLVDEMDFLNFRG